MRFWVFVFWMNFSVFQNNWVFGYSWYTLMLYWCYYPHRLRDALSPVCGIFFNRCWPVVDRFWQVLSIFFWILTTFDHFWPSWPFFDIYHTRTSDHMRHFSNQVSSFLCEESWNINFSQWLLFMVLGVKVQV